MHGSSVYCVCVSECRACLLCKASWTTRYPPGISKHGIMNFSTLTFAICTSTNTHMHKRAHTSTHIPIQHSSHAYVHLLSFSPSHLSLFLSVFLNTLHLVGRTPASTFHTYIMYPTVRIFKKRRREVREEGTKRRKENRAMGRGIDIPVWLVLSIMQQTIFPVQWGTMQNWRQSWELDEGKLWYAGCT